MLFEGPVPVPTAEAASLPARGDNSPVNELLATGEIHASRPQTVLRMSTGQVMSIPTEVLLRSAEPWTPSTPSASPQGPGPLASTTATQTRQAQMPATEAAPEQRPVMTIPVVAEQAEVGKRTVATGTVRVHKDVETFTEDVSVPLTRTAWDVQRTPIGQLYQERPEVRQEGDTTVFPLVEERLVAKREYFLIEEVRIRRLETTSERTATLELKRDVLTVEREGTEDAARV